MEAAAYPAGELPLPAHRPTGLPVPAIRRSVVTSTGKSSLDEVCKLFQGDTSPYWITHYSFGEISRPQTKHLSKASIDLLIINTVVPFLYAYGKYRGQASLTARAGEFLEALKPENNYITRMWKECGLTAAHAGDSQALIQLKKQYCDPKKCLYCRIGYEYFKRRK